MKKIRVIHCLGQLNTGGAETLVMNILRNINREKYQFDFLLFSLNEGFYDKEVLSYDSKIFYTPSMRVGIAKYINSLISFFRKEKTEIIHAHMDWQCGFIAYAAHKAGVKKIIVHSHANQKMFDINMIYHLLILINKFLISNYATHRLACSIEAGESLFGDKKFEVLNNGIEMNRYLDPNQEIINGLKKEFQLQKDDIILGHVGSFSMNKNQSFLIDIMSDLVNINKNYKLILVGTGSMYQDLKNKVVSLDLENNVIFAGVRKEMPEIMHLFRLFLFPSIYEGLGIVAIEAQASGVHCIVSNTIPKVVDLNLGLLEFLSLNKKLWLNTILQFKQKKVENHTKNLFDSDFNIKNTIRMLQDIYNM